MSGVDRPGSSRTGKRGKTKISHGGAKTFSPAHVNNQFHTAKTSVGGRQWCSTFMPCASGRKVPSAVALTNPLFAHTMTYRDSVNHMSPCPAIQSMPLHPHPCDVWLAVDTQNKAEYCEVDCFTLLLTQHLADASCFIGPSTPSGICMQIHTKIVQ